MGGVSSEDHHSSSSPSKTVKVTNSDENLQFSSNIKIKAYAALLPSTKNEDRVCFGSFQSTWSSKTPFYSLADGHGGAAVVEAVSTLLGSALTVAFSKVKKLEDIEPTLIKLVHDLHALTLERLPQDLSGCTLILAIPIKGKLYTVNVGDSKAVIVSPDLMKIRDLTVEQTIEDESEQKRLQQRAKDLKIKLVEPEKVGDKDDENQFYWDKNKQGVVSRLGMLTSEATRERYDVVTRSIATSSSIGDHVFGPLLHPHPVVTITPYNPNSFIVLASDGVWDVMGNKEVHQIFKNLVFPNGPAPASVLREIQKQLPKKAEEKWNGKGRDDISVVVAQLCEKKKKNQSPLKQSLSK